MTESLNSCPAPEQLQALVDGTLPEDEQRATQTHVDGCATCQQVLESQVAGSASWEVVLGHLRNAPSPVGETVFSEALERMKADVFVEAAAPTSTTASPLDFLAPSDQPGSIGRLGVYEVTEVVGQGGMGVVLKAFDPVLHRVVAVKVLAPYLAHNPKARKRFVREAQAIAAVTHDHVITIHAIDESAEQPKIVMQFVAGRSLQQTIDAEGSLDVKEILRIGMQTAAGLGAAHAQGLVHRDVKPSNILLENGIQRVKLTDFGLARAVDDASLTQSGAIAGTPQYMAPEQANGDAVDHRADLFSLGSVLYAMCVGHSPFRASTTMGVLKRVCHDPPRPIQELNPDIPDWLCAIVMKLLAKKPDDRFQTAKSVAQLLEKWLAHVQQPTVVPKPPFVVGTSNSAGSLMPKDPITEAETRTQQLSAKRVVDARTILFQSFSGRQCFFLLLSGVAVTLAVVATNPTHGGIGRIGMAEAVMIGLIGGFWVFCFVATARFLWANFYGIVPWVVTPHKVDGAIEALHGSNNENQRSTGQLPPESVAMLAAIITMLFSFNPFLAAIVAIIVWRVATTRLPIGVSSWRASAGSANRSAPASPQASSNNIDAQTIFFQPISWRALPFFWLLSMAVAFAINSQNGPSGRPMLLTLEECGLLAVPGAGVCMMVWGAARFLWANYLALGWWKQTPHDRDNGQ